MIGATPGFTVDGLGVVVTVGVVVGVGVVVEGVSPVFTSFPGNTFTGVGVAAVLVAVGVVVAGVVAVGTAVATGVAGVTGVLPPPVFVVCVEVFDVVFVVPGLK